MVFGTKLQLCLLLAAATRAHEHITKSPSKNCSDAKGCAPNPPPHLCNSTWGSCCTPYCDPMAEDTHGVPSGWSSTKPNVLLLGDSIAATGSGYLDDVRAILEPGVVVDNPRMYPQGGGYCGSSFGVIGCLNLFTGPPQQLWDVIHFNWGLHDVCPLIKPNATPDMHSTGGYTGITETHTEVVG